MKLNHLKLLCAAVAGRAVWLLLLALGLGALPIRAQTPPPYMTYQGYLTDGSGNPLGATNTGPKAYSVAFEIFTGPTSGSNVWGELQTVTVDNGYYSVLLGQGGAYSGDSHAALSGTLFANPNPLYIQMTVLGIGTSGANVTILPRLQLVSSAFAFSAGSASELVNNLGTPIITSSGGSVTVGGTVSATSITDSGALSAVGITDSGPLSATVVTANSINNAGALSTGSLIDTNALSAGSITASSISTTGSLSAGSITTGGGLSAGSITTGGNLSAGAVNVTGNLWMANGKTIYGTNTTGAAEPCLVPRANDNTTVLRYGTAGLNIANDSNLNAVFVAASGNVGIGTTSPTGAALVVGYGTGSEYIKGPGIGGGIGDYYNTGYYNSANYTDNNISVLAAGSVSATEYHATSDARIKNIQGRSNSTADLLTLLGIEITDYRYKDVIASGDGLHKKVVAQQVEKVFPQAVSKHTGVIPDIYRSATIKDGWVKLATDLKPGDRVKLITDRDSGSIHEVLEVTKDQFRTDFKPDGGQVFVYGREVKDFRTVDYDAIAMLNVSATQELAKNNEILTARVAELEQGLNDLKRLVAKMAEEGKASKLAAGAPSQTPASLPAPKTFTTASLDRN